MTALAAMGLAKMHSHTEKTRLDVMPKDFRMRRSAIKPKRTSDCSAPWGR